MIVPADGTLRIARCTNVASCPRAAGGDALPWYLGAGEYCPDCGEALIAGDALTLPAAKPLTALLPIIAGSVPGDVRTPLTAVDRLSVPPTARDGGYVSACAGSSRRRSLHIVPSSPYRTGAW